MNYAKKDAIFLHCLTAHRGYEVTDEVIDSPKSIVIEEAVNRVVSAQVVLKKILETRT